MSTVDPVPEADHQEQQEPASRDPRTDQPHQPDQPEADVLEQELPVEDADDEPVGLDADRWASPDDDVEGFAPHRG